MAIDAEAPLIPTEQQQQQQTPEAPSEGSTSSSFESFSLGSAFKIPIKVHIAFPIVFILSLVFSSGWNDFSATLFSAIGYGPLLFATVLVHELAHCFAVKSITGGEIESILLWPLGGLTLIGHSSNLLDDLKISIAGPLSHVFQLLVWWGLLFLTRHHLFLFAIHSPMSDFFLENLFAFAVQLNFHLLIFNLFIPAYPLDGGRIISSALLLSGLSSETAAKITLAISTPMALVLILTRLSSVPPLSIFVGFWILIQNFHLFSLIRENRVDSHPLFGNHPTATTMEPF